MILALLILLIAVSSSNNENVIQIPNENIVDLTTKNKTDVIWDGSNVVMYDGYMYYVDRKSTGNAECESKICRIKLTDENKEEVLYKTSQYEIGRRLCVYNNNLFFNVLGQTLYMNLENTNYIKIFCDGILYSIKDGNIIYTYQNKIYKGEYYRETLAVKNPTSLVSGNINFMNEDNINLYFYSNNSDGSVSILKVNKEKHYANVLDRIYMTDYSGQRVIDSEITDKNVYVLLELNMANIGYKYMLKEIEKDGSNTKLIELADYVNELKYADNMNVYFKYYEANEFKKYNEKSEQVEDVKDMPIMYSLQKEESKIRLYKNNSLLCDICEVYRETPQNINIKEYDGYIYIEFDLVDGMSSVEEYMLFRLKNDGTEIKQINKNK